MLNVQAIRRQRRCLRACPCQRMPAEARRGAIGSACCCDFWLIPPTSRFAAADGRSTYHAVPTVSLSYNCTSTTKLSDMAVEGPGTPPLVNPLMLDFEPLRGFIISVLRGRGHDLTDDEQFWSTAQSLQSAVALEGETPAAFATRCVSMHWRHVSCLFWNILTKSDGDHPDAGLRDFMC